MLRFPKYFISFSTFKISFPWSVIKSPKNMYWIVTSLIYLFGSSNFKLNPSSLIGDMYYLRVKPSSFVTIGYFVVIFIVVVYDIDLTKKSLKALEVSKVFKKSMNDLLTRHLVMGESTIYTTLLNKSSTK
jgi:hypothetical protein